MGAIEIDAWCRSFNYCSRDELQNWSKERPGPQPPFGIRLDSGGEIDEPVSASFLPLGPSYMGPESGIDDRLRCKWL